MNDSNYLKNVLNIFSTYVEMLHSQSLKEIAILSACNLCFCDNLPSE